MNVAFRLRGQEFRAAIRPSESSSGSRATQASSRRPSKNVGRPWRVAIFRRAQLQQ
jgi:hypothetical protein